MFTTPITNTNHLATNSKSTNLALMTVVWCYTEMRPLRNKSTAEMLKCHCVIHVVPQLCHRGAGKYYHAATLCNSKHESHTSTCCTIIIYGSAWTFNIVHHSRAESSALSLSQLCKHAEELLMQTYPYSEVLIEGCWYRHLVLTKALSW